LELGAWSLELLSRGELTRDNLSHAPRALVAWRLKLGAWGFPRLGLESL